MKVTNATYWTLTQQDEILCPTCENHNKQEFCSVLQIKIRNGHAMKNLCKKCGGYKERKSNGFKQVYQKRKK